MYDFMVFGYYAAAIGRAFFLCEGEGLRTSVSLTRSPFTVEVGRLTDLDAATRIAREETTMCGSMFPQ